eukprot:scaffold101798_cov40-Tisochrysis_lutea.AAC.3
MADPTTLAYNELMNDIMALAISIAGSPLIHSTGCIHVIPASFRVVHMPRTCWAWCSLHV